MTIDFLVQLMILLSGAPAIWLSQSQNATTQRYACLFGMVGQPAWIYLALMSDHWGVLVVNILVTLSWARGLHTFWIKPWAVKRAA